MNKPLVDRGMLKVLLVKAQEEMRNMILETKERGQSCYAVAETLAQLCSEVIWIGEFDS